MGSVSQWKQRKLSYKCHKLYPEHRKGKGDGEGFKREGKWGSTGHKDHEIHVGESELFLRGNKEPPKTVEDGSGMPDCFRNSILCPEPSVCGSETVKPRSKRPFSRLAIQ